MCQDLFTDKRQHDTVYQHMAVCSSEGSRQLRCQTRTRCGPETLYVLLQLAPRHPPCQLSATSQPLCTCGIDMQINPSKSGCKPASFSETLWQGMAEPGMLCVFMHQQTETERTDLSRKLRLRKGMPVTRASRHLMRLSLPDSATTASALAQPCRASGCIQRLHASRSGPCSDAFAGCHTVRYGASRVLCMHETRAFPP